MRDCCVRFWRACASDRASHGNEDMARCRSDRSAARFQRSECAGADGAGAAAVLRPRVCFSRTQGRHDQASLVRWRRPLPVCQAIGARPIHLAAGYGRHCLPDPCAAFDAARRHRLAQAGEDLDAGDRGLIDQRDSSVFMQIFWCIPIASMAYCVHGYRCAAGSRFARSRSIEGTGPGASASWQLSKAGVGEPAADTLRTESGAAFQQRADRTSEADHREAEAEDVRRQEREDGLQLEQLELHLEEMESSQAEMEAAVERMALRLRNRR